MDRYIYEQEPVGHGGFGKVRAGQDQVLERKIAVKILDPAWAAANDEDKERFGREARILAKLSHPNIPSIYDVILGDKDDEGNERFEIIFEFVEGTTLRDILNEESTISLSECRSWFDQVASALQNAHENEIIHRDVKPENMIVSLDRRHCYLVDFGIALSQSELERLTGSDEWIGTPGYMSPEQQEGKELDPSDDLYVLGGCLYEALSGHKIQQGDYQPLTACNELIPPALDDLVQKCIASKPQRLDSAEEFRRLFASALHGHRTFSQVLVRGQLHEMVTAIAEMTPTEFMNLKAGQRLLILQKCNDIVAEPDTRLDAARHEFLSVMAPLGVELQADQYRRIIAPAIRHGFGVSAHEENVYAHGNIQIREQLNDAAMQVGETNHHVIVEELANWLDQLDLESQKKGLYHSLRLLINALMANPNCKDEDAPKLASRLQRVNELQRARAQDSSVSSNVEHRTDEPVAVGSGVSSKNPR